MLNLRREKLRRRAPGRGEKILSDHRQDGGGDGNLAVGGSGNLSR